MVSRPSINIQKVVEKTIFRPSLCTSFTWPPYKCLFKEDQTPIKISKKEMCINHYINRNNIEALFGKRKERLSIDSYFLTEKECLHFLEEGFEIEDQECSIHRFIPELLRAL